MNIFLRFIIWMNGGQVFYENGKQHVQLKTLIGMGRNGGYAWINYKVRYFVGIPILSPVSFSPE